MKAQEAYNQLDAKKWAETSVKERLTLLRQIQDNLENYGNELAKSDGDMKNTIVGDESFFHGFNLFGTVAPIAGAVVASITLYESLKKGKLLRPTKLTQVTDAIWDVEVFPHTSKEKMLSGKQRGHLRIKGVPKQINPMEKQAGVIAVLGAGNYSSSLEMVKALFWENKVVIHKPHHLNEKTDKIWEKVFEPLVKRGALSFCTADQGREVTTLKGLHSIYFTGGATTAQSIMEATDTPLVSECGGNNPLLIVPGDREWTEKEIVYQAIKVASMIKMNGGAVCGRAQTILTSKQWSQREQFLHALRTALAEQTIAIGTYYPGSDEVRKGFKEAYPTAETIESKNGEYNVSSVLLITDAEEDGYAARNEAFCQVVSEIPLDVPATIHDFLPHAVEVSNNKLLGTLACMILIDDATRSTNQEVLDQAITTLNYGGITINTIPPRIFFNPYLTWGGCNETKETFVSGIGNFGNVMNFENVEKSILYDQFISPGDMLLVDRELVDQASAVQVNYIIRPTWKKIFKMFSKTIMNR